MRILKSIIIAIWNYLRPSWEGEDNKISYRRSSQFVFLALICVMVLRNTVQGRWGFYTLFVLCITFLLLAAIITADQIIHAIQGFSSIPNSLTNGSASVEETIENTEGQKESG